MKTNHWLLTQWHVTQCPAISTLPPSFNARSTALRTLALYQSWLGTLTHIIVDEFIHDLLKRSNVILVHDWQPVWSHLTARKNEATHLISGLMDLGIRFLRPPFISIPDMPFVAGANLRFSERI